MKINIYVIARVCQYTPGQAYKVQLACTGFYGESHLPPAFTSKAKAESYLEKNKTNFHKVKPHHAGQQWEVIKLNPE